MLNVASLVVILKILMLLDREESIFGGVLIIFLRKLNLRGFVYNINDR